MCIFCTHWENDLGAIIEYRFNCHCFGELQPFHNVVYMLFVSICSVFNSRKPFVNLHNDYEHSLCIAFGLVRLWRLVMRTTITRNMKSERICAHTHINSITHILLNVICITQELFLFSIIAHLHKHNNNNAYAVLSSGWSSIWTPRVCVCFYTSSKMQTQPFKCKSLWHLIDRTVIYHLLTIISECQCLWHRLLAIRNKKFW